MGIGNKQIGWSNESNLLWDISNQLDRLTKVIAANTGGGGGTNPTSTFMPFNNAGTFADSFLVNDTTNNVLKSVYSGNDIGLNLDFGQNVFSINNNNSSQGFFYYEDTATFIIGHNPEFTDGSGLKIDAKNYYRLGDYDVGSNGNYLFINNVDNEISTYNGGNKKGLQLNFANNQFLLGDFDIINNGTSLYIDDNTQSIYTKQGDDKGLKLDFSLLRYYLGDFDGVYNSTSIGVFDDNQNIYFYSGIGAYNFANVPTYANNDDALNAGLSAGNIYILNEFAPIGSAKKLCIVY